MSFKILTINNFFVGCLMPRLVRSGQVRSECLTCTFKSSCCSARLSRAQVPGGGEGVRGDRLHWRAQGSTSSPTGISSRRRVVSGVMEFEMSRRIKPKRNMCATKEIWRNLDGPLKNKELWSYVVKFEFSRPKAAQQGWCALF